jgi:hypothetical protein
MVTEEDLIENALAAYQRGRLVAQMPNITWADCNHLFSSDRKCPCAVGASLPDHLIPTMGRACGLPTSVFTETKEGNTIYGQLMKTHDGWANARATRQPQRKILALENEFRAILGLQPC